MTTKPFTERQRQWLDLALKEAGDDVERGEKVAEETGRDLWRDVMPELWAARPLPDLPTAGDEDPPSTITTCPQCRALFPVGETCEPCSPDSQSAPGQPFPDDSDPEEPPPAPPAQR